jgi:beta-lactamase superfamily II metal-dependent hydrolase
MYRVGFGDFFLVSVPAGSGYKHILIDCGVHSKDVHSIQAAVDHMAQETGKELALIIVTHRHADHVTGFSKCKAVFAQFKVERIWMSWYEDPEDPKAVTAQSNIAALAFGLQHTLAARGDTGSDESRMVGNITDAFGATGTQNPAAFAVLHAFPGDPPIDYYKAGDTPTLPPSLLAAGLEAQILGPPTDPNLIAKTDNSSQEYIVTTAVAPTGPIRPFSGAFRVKPADYTTPVFDLIPRTVVESRVASVQPDMLAAQAAMANNVINNQSLMTLFTYKGKTLLFAGDAQWGNWANFLYGNVNATVLRPEAVKILSKVDVYKVGHHGSTNATPKIALATMRPGCVALCSTAIGAYNRVPRDELITAINQQTHNQLARSDQVAAGDAPADPGAGGPLPPIFKAVSIGLDDTKCGYIDYVA